MLRTIKTKIILSLSIILFVCCAMILYQPLCFKANAEDSITLTDTKLSVNGDLYSVNLTVDETDYNLRFAQQNGAYIRIKAPAGIRFLSFISESDYTALVEAYGSENVILGSIVIISSVGEEFVPTFDNLEGKTYKNCVAEKIGRYKLADEGEDNGIYRFCTVISNIPTEEYDTVITARSYIKVIKGGETYVAYTDYSNTYNRRSIRYVANAVANSTETFKNSEWDTIESFANVVDKTGLSVLEIEAQGTNDLKNQVAAEASAKGLFTVSSANINKIVDEGNLVAESTTREDVKNSSNSGSGYLYDTDAGSMVARTRTLRVYTDSAIYRIKAFVFSKVITTAVELQNLQSYSKISDSGVSEQSRPYCAYDGYFVLGNNIDLEGKTVSTNFGIEYTNINSTDCVDFTLNRGFIGTFDGNGYTLIGGTYSQGGLFGSVARAGVVKNLAITDATVSRVAWEGAYHNMSCVMAGLYFAGTMDNVLIEVKGYSGSGMGMAVAGNLAMATVTNTVVYSPLMFANYIWNNNNSVGRTACSATNVVFVGDGDLTNSYGRSAAFYNNVQSVAAGTVCSNITTNAFSSPYWNFDYDNAAFNTCVAFNSREYEQYTSLNGSYERVGSNLVIDTTGFTVPADSIITIGSTDVSSQAAIGASSVTIPANSFKTYDVYGDVELKIDSPTLRITVPVTVYTAILTDANDIVYFQNYSDKTNEGVSSLEFTAGANNGMVSNRPYYDYGGYFVLGSNISLSGDITTDFGFVYNPYAPDASGYYNQLEVGFRGVFDGRGYTINGGTYSQGGIFGEVSKYGVIKNVALSNAMVRRDVWEGSPHNMSCTMATIFAGTMDNVLIDVSWTWNGSGNSGTILAGVIVGATISNTIIYDRGNQSLQIANSAWRAETNITASKATNVVFVGNGAVASTWRQSSTFAVDNGITKYAKSTTCATINEASGFSGFSDLSAYWNFTGTNAAMVHPS